MIDADSPLRIGIIGTSWWADSMYLPALDAHPDAEVVGICGRTRSTAWPSTRSVNCSSSLARSSPSSSAAST